MLLALLTGLLGSCASHDKWHQASRESAGLAPDPQTTSEAVIQVYGADAFGWYGWFAIHTWVATKRSGEKEYTVYDVVGWRAWPGQTVVREFQDIPDRYWYGARPRLLSSHQGEDVDALIDAVEAAVASYPWPQNYEAFPGPNSNTFTAWIAQQVPQLDLDLPFSAIGSGYADASE